MGKYHLFFTAASGFILGAISGGLGFSPLNLLLFLLFATLILFFIFKKYQLPANFLKVVFLGVIFLAAGNFYYTFDDYQYHLKKDSLRTEVYFQGRIIDEPRRTESKQVVKIKIKTWANLENSATAKILVYLPSYPEFHYGDLVKINGLIELPGGDSYGRYLAKERISGQVFYPEIELIGHEGIFFWQELYGLRNKIKEIIGQLFNSAQAAFLSGILLGDRDQFSKDFLEKLSLSGTLHLSALSGDHMIIIIFMASIILTFIFRNRPRFIFITVFIFVILFVAMTGFQVSAVRAAAMALIVALAERLGRAYSPRNALSATALIITLFNPKAPVFDIAFQLSFAATISIIYLAPIFRRFQFFKIGGFLGWRDVLLITLVAQIGVAPITMINFSNFSLTALPANIGILIFVPFLMVLGFATIISGAFFMPLAGLLSKPTGFLINYASGVIDFFSRFQLPFNPQIGMITVIIYYALLILICFRFSPDYKMLK